MPVGHGRAWQLTTRQRAHVRVVFTSVVAEAKREGLTVRTNQRMKFPFAFYDPDDRSIVLGPVPRKQPPTWTPGALNQLFSLAHELGHHKSYVEHEKIGRDVDLLLPPDALFEEARAWRHAFQILRRHKMAGRALWDALSVATSNALAHHVYDFEAHWWLVERLKRLRICCPKCGSRALSVLGEESRRDCTIACRACGTHTRPRRSVQLLADGVRGRKFTGLCRIRFHKTDRMCS